MSTASDPTAAIRRRAAKFAGVEMGASCTQTSFKAGKATFLFIGPGAKGIGFKAMFKLKASMAEAQKLATKQPQRFEVGKTGWVTARFTVEEPLPEKIWEKWIAESYAVASGGLRQK